MRILNTIPREGAISKRDCLTNVSTKREENKLFNLNIFMHM